MKNALFPTTEVGEPFRCFLVMLVWAALGTISILISMLDATCRATHIMNDGSNGTCIFPEMLQSPPESIRELRPYHFFGMGMMSVVYLAFLIVIVVNIFRVVFNTSRTHESSLHEPLLKDELTQA